MSAFEEYLEKIGSEKELSLEEQLPMGLVAKILEEDLDLSEVVDDAFEAMAQTAADEVNSSGMVSQLHFLLFTAGLSSDLILEEARVLKEDEVT